MLQTLSFVLIKTPLPFSKIICRTESELQGAPGDAPAGVGGGGGSPVFSQLSPRRWLPLALPPSPHQVG